VALRRSIQVTTILRGMLMWSADESTTKLRPRPPLGSPSQRVIAFWDGGSFSQELPAGARLVIGRSEDCDVRIPDESVSRRHAVVHGGPPPRIEDLGSANGVHLGELRLEPNTPTVLLPGNVAELGAALIVVRAMDEPPARTVRPPSQPPELDAGMQRVRTLVDAVAKTTIPVLLLGETGVGKGLIAEMIHRRSPRVDGPFVRLNCAALAETLLESELFGHERGAFTGATQAKPGLLESAKGGSVLLDEVGDMPLSTQAKLLHALEHGEVLPVGGVRPRPIDVRFIAATNRDLQACVAAGTFRQDLYFRLNGVTITVPPLRERHAEIPGLARAFVREASAQLGRPTMRLSDQALQWLLDYPWPGNVRELRNLLVRATLFAPGGVIGVEHLAHESPAPAKPAASTLHAQVRDLEARRIAEALERHGHNQVETAKALGIARGTLRSRMKELGLLPERTKSRG
jgi:two-component system response regulator AtoC